MKTEIQSSLTLTILVKIQKADQAHASYSVAKTQEETGGDSLRLPPPPPASLLALPSVNPSLIERGFGKVYILM